MILNPRNVTKLNAAVLANALGFSLTRAMNAVLASFQKTVTTRADSSGKFLPHNQAERRNCG
jgi:hypothetical protein